MDNIGRVDSVRNEICFVTALEGVGLGNVVSFSSGARGLVLGFEGTRAEVIMLHGFAQVKKGDLVRVSAPLMTTKVSNALLGRVIDPLGTPLDGLGEVETYEGVDLPIESPARPIYQRAIINRPLVTGYMVIDSQIPIGLGQRELLLGEKKSGQTDTAIDILCNQAKLDTGLIPIYVAIDAETAGTKRRIERLEKSGALKNGLVIVGRTAQAAALNYIAPMVGVTIAEWFASKGKNVLIVFDDLTRHAKVYRQIALLLGRPASREAYPGDIFYLHSRLLERCGSFNAMAGSGTITGLPIVESQSEEATDYVTTNLMSITDGHVLFRQTLANRGNRPPIDSGFSVSRIGGRAQMPLIRTLSEKLKEIIIRYEEVIRFMAFGSDLSESARPAYEIGIRASNIFQQDHNDGYSNVQQAVLMYFIISRTANSWSEDQMPALCKYIADMVTNKPYSDVLNQSMLAMPFDHAEILLKEFMVDLAKAPGVPVRAERKERLVAETETLEGVLRNDEEILK